MHIGYKCTKNKRMAKFLTHNCTKKPSFFFLTFFSTHLGDYSTHKKHIIHNFASKSIHQLLTTSKIYTKNANIIGT